MEVIGIDVAPKRGGHVCDGKCVKYLKPAALEKYLREELPKNVLIAWDAPLTGPRDPDKPCTNVQDLTTRKIESFFQTSKFEFKAPPGVSVLGYGSCPHWTISRALLGLPRVGQYDAPLAGLPFELVTNDQDRRRTGRRIIEVHPAVALWLWCKADGYEGPWRYKGSKKDETALAKLAKLMSLRLKNEKVVNADHDQLDAWTAWHLANCWLHNNGVMLLGSAQYGSFLLPHDPKLKDKFGDFVRSRVSR